MRKLTKQQWKGIWSRRPGFHPNIFHTLRERGYPTNKAIELSDIACCECGGYADHWHTMTGTTADDHNRDLDDLVEGCILTSSVPMACGHRAELSLETGGWCPHCEECENRLCERCGEEFRAGDLDQDGLCEDCTSEDEEIED